MDKTTKRYIQLIKNAQAEYSEEYFAVAIPEFMSKKFIAYCAMKRDLELVLEYIQFLKISPQNMTIKSSLTFSTIALYGKCFTDASKYPSEQLLLISWFSLFVGAINHLIILL